MSVEAVRWSNREVVNGALADASEFVTWVIMSFFFCHNFNTGIHTSKTPKGRRATEGPGWTRTRDLPLNA